jgi:hypothetical protein
MLYEGNREYCRLNSGVAQKVECLEREKEEVETENGTGKCLWTLYEGGTAGWDSGNGEGGVERVWK